MSLYVKNGPIRNVLVISEYFWFFFVIFLISYHRSFHKEHILLYLNFRPDENIIFQL